MKDYIFFDRILQENQALFDEKPLCAQILSHLSDLKNAELNKSCDFVYFVKFLLIAIFGLLNKGKFLSNKNKAVFYVNSNRSIGWNRIWSIVKEFDKFGIPYFFNLSVPCYLSHRIELKSLNNATLLIDSFLSTHKQIKCSFSDINTIFYHYKVLRPIIKQYKIASIWTFLYYHLFFIGRANGLYRNFFNSCLFSLSNGDRIYGYLNIMYGIKHFGIQHGIEQQNMVGLWTTLIKYNVYCAFTFGDYYSTIYKKSLGTNCFSVGSLMDKPKSYNSRNINKKDIVYFSDSIVLENGKLSDHQKQTLERTFDLIIFLYKSIGNKYDIKIKLHPNETDVLWRQFSPLFGNEIEIISGETNSIAVLEETFASISWGNTVALESVVNNVVSIQYLVEDTYSPQEFSFCSIDEKEILQLIMNSNRMKNELQRQRSIIGMYVKSTDHIEDKIIKYIRKSVGI